MSFQPSYGARTAAFCALILLFVGQTAAAQASTLAECAAIQSDTERLACYDRISGARPAAPSELEIVAPSEPVAAAPSAPAPSLIDAAWGFTPDAPKFILATYRPNYLLFARYT
ncbi:MAG TPA: hypothetical protein VK852_08175, partial [Desulfobacterales bacterium]|nr:hypothetical protein [Desulfobacterales bacterium]